MVARQAASRARLGAEIGALVAARKAQQIPRDEELLDGVVTGGSLDLRLPSHPVRPRSRRQQKQQQQQQQQGNLGEVVLPSGRVRNGSGAAVSKQRQQQQQLTARSSPSTQRLEPPFSPVSGGAFGSFGREGGNDISARAGSPLAAGAGKLAVASGAELLASLKAQNATQLPANKVRIRLWWRTLACALHPLPRC